ncbi:unnamed protein product [Adineta ricciae]|uniref:G-protein coupled receptors family 1 profile domain-containing protein n=1 Tax=Adineta ricciae TaxID=249248 RepID=A0A815P5Q9_ADIRI|nr:unnamed protein product [Adineta ricciae]
MLFDRTLRQALHNHVIIVLLFICFLADCTLYPWMLYFYQNRDRWDRSMIFCTIWGFLDWGLYVLHTMLFAWATVERHILIFHDRWISTRKSRLILHYFPLLFFPFYLFLFYFCVYFFPPCENYSDPSSPVCMWPCLYDSYALSIISLLVRVLWQRVRMRQTIHWKKHRKMAIQVLSISCVYLLLLLPYAIIYILRYCVGLSYPLLIEFSTSTVFTKLQTRMRNLLHLRPARHIQPGMTISVRTHPTGNDRRT